MDRWKNKVGGKVESAINPAATSCWKFHATPTAITVGFDKNQFDWTSKSPKDT